jgi:hypothetical protein
VLDEECAVAVFEDVDFVVASTVGSGATVCRIAVGDGEGEGAIKGWDVINASGCFGIGCGVICRCTAK